MKMKIDENGSRGVIDHDPRASKLPVFREGLNFPRILTFLLQQTLCTTISGFHS